MLWVGDVTNLDDAEAGEAESPKEFASCHRLLLVGVRIKIRSLLVPLD